MRLGIEVKYLPPPYASEGGHPRKLVEELLKYVPHHEIYIQPFFGGGSIFWSKPKVKLEIINDVNPVLTNFLKQLQRATIKDLECDMRPSKEKFYALRDNIKTICDFLYVNRYSYRGNMKSFALRVPCYDNNRCLLKLKRNLERYKDRLKDVIIETMDFRDLIKKYRHLDGPKTFWFVDPPYPVYTKERGCRWDVGCGMHPKTVYDAVKDLKGKVMVTESDDPLTRSVFLSDGKFKELGTFTYRNTTLITGYNRKLKETTVKHLILVNYDIT